MGIKIGGLSDRNREGLAELLVSAQNAVAALHKVSNGKGEIVEIWLGNVTVLPSSSKAGESCLNM